MRVGANILSFFTTLTQGCFLEEKLKIAEFGGMARD